MVSSPLSSTTVQLHAANRPQGLSRRRKLVVSLLVAVHLLAVLAEPFRFFTYGGSRGSSPAAEPVRVALGPYIEFAYLNHGYFFFAPEPGPSHLMQCDLTFDDGSISHIRYPDKQAQWPRLLYHRHFMLAEFLNQLHAPPIDPALIQQAPAAESEEWKRDRARFEDVRNSMQAHLVHRYGATSATIQRVRHVLPGSDAVLKNKLPLSDPSLYIVLPDSIPSDPAQPSPVTGPDLNSKTGQGEEVEARP
ncbi:MAG TPA: hypothetical protein DCF63_04895 [Planctomycetaceae bacterium]|nr:hypothetical protein [Planctomycetaceae bacterium]